MSMWEDEASCVDADINDMVPDGANVVYNVHPGNDTRYRAAQTIARYCATCPVVAECAAAAVDRRETGIWGGQLFAEGIPRDLGAPQPPRPLHPKTLRRKRAYAKAAAREKLEAAYEQQKHLLDQIVTDKLQ